MRERERERERERAWRKREDPDQISPFVLVLKKVDV